MITKDTATQQYIIQIADGPSAEDEARNAGRILAAIVGRRQWQPSVLGIGRHGPGRIRRRRRLRIPKCGDLMSYLCCAPEAAAENLQRMTRVYEQLERDGITADELELAKNKICSHLVRQSERPSNRLFSIGNGWLQRRSYQTVKERLGRLSEHRSGLSQSTARPVSADAKHDGGRRPARSSE